MKQFYTLLILLALSTSAYSQGSITAAGTGGAVPINFSGTTAGILNGTWAGLQISATPAAGELNMNGVYIRDNISGAAEDASVVFGAGGTLAASAAMQGAATGGVTSGGVYAFDIGSGNIALGVQPNSSRWNDFPSDEGHIIFKFTNNSGITLNSFTAGFTMIEYNDNSRRSILEAYLTDDIATPTFGAAMFSQSTGAAAAAVPTWNNLASPTFTKNITVANGGSVYFRFLVYEGSGGSGSRDQVAIDDIFIYGNAAALPVQMSPLSANVNSENTVQLDWNTSSEENNAVFEIQRGTNGIHFKTIGYRKGQLASNHIINYSFEDKEAINGINYYRIKQVDIDEKYSFSNITQVDVTKVGNFEALVYPNPIVNQQLNIDLESAISDVAKVEIYNLNGQIILSNSWPLSKGLNKLPLTINKLPKGNYILSIKGENIVQQQLIFVGE